MDRDNLAPKFIATFIVEVNFYGFAKVIKQTAKLSREYQ